MKFIDYNDTGGLDPQDIATSVAIEEATHEDASEKKTSSGQLYNNAGCATMAALIALPILILIAAL